MSCLRSNHPSQILFCLLLQGRLFAYPDTHRHRLGPNYLQIPVNCPYRTRVANYQRDGPMCVTDNQGRPEDTGLSCGAGAQEQRMRGQARASWWPRSDSVSAQWQTAGCSCCQQAVLSAQPSRLWLPEGSPCLDLLTDFMQCAHLRFYLLSIQKLKAGRKTSCRLQSNITDSGATKWTIPEINPKSPELRSLEMQKPGVHIFCFFLQSCWAWKNRSN